MCVFVNCPPVTALMMSGELGDSDLEVPSGHVISEAEPTARINEGKDAAELKLLKERVTGEKADDNDRPMNSERDKANLMSDANVELARAAADAAAARASQRHKASGVA